MSVEEIYQAIGKIKNTIDSWVIEYEQEISPSFHFTGGEPTLRKELFDILNYSRQCGFSTALMTNGTLITHDIAEKLHEAQVHDVQVSLDGLEEIHDSIRGKGSFKQALIGIKNLVSCGVDVNINLTISRLNMDEIYGLVRLAKQLGVSAVSYSRLVICGRGKQLGKELLTPQELAGIHSRSKKIKTDGVEVISRDPLSNIIDSHEELPDSEFPIGGCAAGVFGITIACDGEIMPCRRMDLSIGNIKKDSFRQLWAESPVLWSLRERKYYHGNCGTCRYWAICRGCRAIALAFARTNQKKEDYLGSDPQCPYYIAGRTTEPQQHEHRHA